MSFNKLFQLVDSGLDSDEIVRSLIKYSPNIAKKVKKYLFGGYGSSEILSLLKKDKEVQNIDLSRFKPSNPEEQANYLVMKGKLSKEKGQDQRSREGLQDFTSKLVDAGLLAGTAYGAYKALPRVAQGIGSAIGSTLGTPKTPGPSPQPPVQSPVIPPVQSNQPQQIQTPKLNTNEVVNNLGVKNQIDNLIKAGNSPEQAAHTLNAILKSDQKKWYGEKMRSGELPPLQKLVENYIQENETDFKPMEEKKSKPVEKGSQVLTPDGKIGNIESISGDNVLISEGGKKKQIKLEDIEEEPEDVIETVSKLLDIPEVDRSSVVSLFNYDPEDNEMFIQFHSGDTYKYFDVDPDKVFKVADKLGIPITKGKNVFGAWSPNDKKSLGAALIKEFIRDPKYGKENLGKTYKRLDTLYDFWQKLRKQSKRKS